MARPSRLLLAKDDILALLGKSPQAVYTQNQLAGVLAHHRHAWHLPDSVRTADFIAFLIKQGDLHNRKLRSGKYGLETTRYVWGKASPHEVALSLKPRAYLSHGTAALLHGLTGPDRKNIYINAEQSEKPTPAAAPTQQGIDRAFSGNQRSSQLIYAYGAYSIVQLSGKHTDRLGVEDIKGPNDALLAATNLERTLIDIVVRPAYAGGPSAILKAYQSAKDRVSIDKLLKILKNLDHVYPYHQAIGFLMERARYPKKVTDRLRALGFQHDFYLAHRMGPKSLSADWRLYYPKDL